MNAGGFITLYVELQGGVIFAIVELSCAIQDKKERPVFILVV